MIAWLDFVRRMSIVFILAVAISILFVGVFKIAVASEGMDELGIDMLLQGSVGADPLQKCEELFFKSCPYIV